MSAELPHGPTRTITALPGLHKIWEENPGIWKANMGNEEKWEERKEKRTRKMEQWKMEQWKKMVAYHVGTVFSHF